MHMGLVSHQHAKWQPPPEKWASLPESNAPSPSGKQQCLARTQNRQGSATPAGLATAAGCVFRNYDLLLLL